VLAQSVTAFPPVVGYGQRLAAFGHNSIPPHEIPGFREDPGIGPAEPGLPATPHQTWPDREHAVRLQVQVP